MDDRECILLLTDVEQGSDFSVYCYKKGYKKEFTRPFTLADKFIPEKDRDKPSYDRLCLLPQTIK